MRVEFRFAAFIAACLLFLPADLSRAFGAEPPSKFEAQLIWGTNAAKSPDPRHKPVEGELKKKLEELPLKWKNYFIVNKKIVEVTPAGPKRVNMSDKCDIEIRLLPKGSIEVSLFGKGAPVLKRTQALPKDETLLVGGNAPNSTAWLVAVKRVD